MKKNKLIVLAAFISSTLFACAGNNIVSSSNNSKENDSSSSSQEQIEKLDIISPAGAPTLAIYDLVNEKNLKTTTKPADVLLAAKTSVDKDVLIFDGVNALNLINKGATKTPWKLARWLTGGNFYLVSTKHNASETLTADSKICSFGEGNLPDLVFKKLLKDHFKVTIKAENFDYKAGTAEVSAALGSKEFAQSYDYFFIAEPSLMAAKNSLSKLETPLTVNEIYNLRDEWKKYSSQDYIPQAALFINGNTYSKKQASFDNFLEKVDSNLNEVISNPQAAKEKLDALEPDLTKQKDRLGYNSSIMLALQKNNQNRFGMVDRMKITDNRFFINEFNKKINGEEGTSFPETIFLN